MKQPRKHAELIKAWADGAEIQIRVTLPNPTDNWIDCDQPVFASDLEYRIKPEPKPDVVRWCWATTTLGESSPTNTESTPNLVLRFDGETGKLKSAEVI